MIEKPVREHDKFMLRLPDGMRKRIAELARQNGRSMNAEIIARIEKTLENDDTIDIIWKKVEFLEAIILEYDDRFNIDERRRFPE